MLLFRVTRDVINDAGDYEDV